MVKYIILGVVVIVTASCNDWLDVKPTSELDRSDLFSSESGYAEALAGVYSNMTKPSLYGRELTYGTLDVLGGIYYPSITGEYASMLQYSYKRENSNYSSYAAAKIDNIWDGLYKQIANVNSILETIDGHKSIFERNNYNVIKGEALGLRAFLHFELLKLYGPSFASGGGESTVAIPYVIDLSTNVSPLLTVEDAFNFIISDLKKAKELLVDDPIVTGETPSSALASLPGDSYSEYGIEVWHNRRFCFNYYAAVATLARAYLWKGDKVSALLYANEVISAQESTFPWVNNENVATIGTSSKNQDRTFATEHIFALNIKGINEYMQGYCYFGTSSSVNSSLSPFAYFSYGGIFEGSTDFRQVYLVSSNAGDLYCNKYYQYPELFSFFQERVPLIRISEMYYIAAECETDLNQARLRLDEVRSHRGLSNMPLSESISREELEIEIRKEYQKEFIAEGQMWYYLKRKDIDLTDWSINYPYHIYYFTNKNMYVFDRPDDEDANR